MRELQGFSRVREGRKVRRVEENTTRAMSPQRGEETEDSTRNKQYTENTR